MRSCCCGAAILLRPNLERQTVSKSDMPWIAQMDSPTLRGDIREALKSEVTATALRTKGWDDLTEEQQVGLNKRFDDVATAVIARTMELINSRDAPHLQGDLKKYAATDKAITLTIVIDAGPEAFALVGQLVGLEVTVVGCEALAMAGEKRPARFRRDQPDLPMGDTEDNGGDDDSGFDDGAEDLPDVTISGSEDGGEYVPGPGEPDMAHIASVIGAPLADETDGGEGEAEDDVSEQVAGEAEAEFEAERQGEADAGEGDAAQDAAAGDDAGLEPAGVAADMPATDDLIPEEIIEVGPEKLDAPIAPPVRRGGRRRPSEAVH
jgi:hypothetical protein